uniref:F-box domain-containing protein n=1 Tax=Oryza barthii TaxID=65489 RepID=A0A0D3F0A6_9ORYZ
MNDDVVSEILLRLPAKAVLRSRAVCRTWRRITTAHYFITAYSRRRPLQLLGNTDPSYYVTPFNTLTSLPATAVPRIDDGGDIAGCRRLLHRDRFCLGLEATCDGLLLFRRVQKGSMLICNPATRQLVNLPPVSPEPSSRPNDNELRALGFYFHRPSGEYRVLCHRPLLDVDATYILSTGAAEPRRLGGGPDYHRCTMVVGETIGDTVYWCRPRYLHNGKPQISSFDTVSEAFRLLPPPPVSLAKDELVAMIDMHVTPAVWTMTELHLDVWALDEEERWVRRLGVQMVVVTWAWKLLYDDTNKDGFRSSTLEKLMQRVALAPILWVRRLRVGMPPPPAPLAYWSKGSRKNAVATFESGDGGVQMVVVTWAWKLLYDDTSKEEGGGSHYCSETLWTFLAHQFLVSCLPREPRQGGILHA